MGITISADEPRSIRAIELAANAAHWRRWRTAEGQEAFGIPSQSRRDRSYVVTTTTCNCADFLRAVESGEPRPCKHVLAVRLYLELVKAQEHTPPAVRRSHLRLVN